LAALEWKINIQEGTIAKLRKEQSDQSNKHFAQIIDANKQIKSLKFQLAAAHRTIDIKSQTSGAPFATIRPVGPKPE
jgi:hypothetical protein